MLDAVTLLAAVSPDAAILPCPPPGAGEITVCGRRAEKHRIQQRAGARDPRGPIDNIG